MNKNHFLSNELIEAIYFSIIETKNSNQNIITLDFLFLGVLKNKKNLAYKLFSKLYENPDLVLKNLRKNISEQTKKLENNNDNSINFTPAVEKLIYKLLFLMKKNSVKITTKDLFILLIKTERINSFLKNEKFFMN
jgi:ATP-dependent Clp protease ATP-binding subunit ClpA